jgi:predicted neutral ceramidase superfamily lipid hydrolase
MRHMSWMVLWLIIACYNSYNDSHRAARILLDSNNINDLLNRRTKYFSRLINNIIGL